MWERGNKIRGLIFIFGVFFFVYPRMNLAAEQVGSTKNEPIIAVSFVDLLANPDRYHKKFIRIQGFLRLEFEGNGIYLSRDDAEYMISKNAFWVEPDPKLWGDPLTQERVDLEKLFNGKWVLIEGIFDRDHHGHMGSFSGAIKKITRIMELEKRYK